MRARIPTNTQVIQEFIAEAEHFQAAAMTEQDERVALMQQGNADARKALADRLAYVQAQRAADAANAASELAEALENLGKKWGQLIRGAGSASKDGTEK